MTRTSFQQGWVERRNRKDGEVWLLRYRLRDPESISGWKVHTETIPGCLTKKAALKELNKRVGDANSRNNGPARQAPITFSSFAEGLWIQYLENKAVKPSTRSSYKSMLKNHLEPAFGGMTLDEITPPQLTAFFEKLRKDKAASHYQLNLYSMLQTMFAVAADYGLIDSTPLRKKLHRPKSEPKEKATLTPEEIKKILAEVSGSYRTLFQCLALTGLRTGELLGLRWKNLDWNARKLSVTHSLWRSELVTPKTKQSVRALHLPDVLYEMLRAHHASSLFRDPEAFVFCRADGSPCDPNYLRKEVLYPAMDAAGIERSPRSHGFHLFRHSAASIAHAATQNLKVTQELLGHSRMSTTADIYVHGDRKGAKTAMEALAKAILPTCSQTAHNSVVGSDRVQ